MKKVRVKKKRKIALVLCAVLLYLIGGASLPLLHHRQADETAMQFAAESCYAAQPGSERVAYIDDNVEALLWRIRVTEAAQEELIFSTFDFGDDQAGRDMMALFYHAAERGVHVKILIDGINSLLKLSGSYHFDALNAHPNVEVKIYHSGDLLRPWKAMLRMHDKYLAADDEVYLLGGRNTNNLFLGDYSDKQNLDRDLLVYETKPAKKDTSMVQLREYFEKMWNLPCCRERVRDANRKKTIAAREALVERYQELQEEYPQAFETTDFRGATMAANRITLLTNPIEPVNKAPNLWHMLCKLMEGGQNIRIQTPYIVCSGGMYRDLGELYDAGSQLKIMTNAVESGANPFGCADYLNQKKKILSTGAEVYELLAEHSSHTKTILVDERLSIVGSFNLDMRSAYLDTELMLAVDCRALNAKLAKEFERRSEQSRHVTADGAAADGKEYQAREMSLLKKCMYGVIKTVTIPFRQLL